MSNTPDTVPWALLHPAAAVWLRVLAFAACILTAYGLTGIIVFSAWTLFVHSMWPWVALSVGTAMTSAATVWLIHSQLLDDDNDTLMQA